MQTVALAAREHSYLLFLVGSCEIEPRQIGAGIDVPAAHAEALHPLGYHLIHAAFGQKVMVGLVDISDLHGLAHIECACIRCLLTHDEAEQCGLAGSVGTYHTHNAALRERE